MRRVRRLPSRTPEAHCVWYLWGPVRPSLFVRPFAACGRGETGPGGAFVRRDVCVSRPCCRAPCGLPLCTFFTCCAACRPTTRVSRIFRLRIIRCSVAAIVSKRYHPYSLSPLLGHPFLGTVSSRAVQGYRIWSCVLYGTAQVGQSIKLTVACGSVKCIQL